MLYGAISTLAVSLVILNAFKGYSNFYSVAVHLSRSNRSVMVRRFKTRVFFWYLKKNVFRSLRTLGSLELL